VEAKKDWVKVGLHLLGAITTVLLADQVLPEGWLAYANLIVSTIGGGQ
jgi:hypothetical protein